MSGEADSTRSAAPLPLFMRSRCRTAGGRRRSRLRVLDQLLRLEEYPGTPLVIPPRAEPFRRLLRLPRCHARRREQDQRARHDPLACNEIRSPPGQPPRTRPRLAAPTPLVNPATPPSSHREGSSRQRGWGRPGLREAALQSRDSRGVPERRVGSLRWSWPTSSANCRADRPPNSSTMPASAV
jgi:hypothetical protein